MKTSNIKVDLIDHCGSDLSVVNAARVSFHKESDWDWIDPGTGERLVLEWDGQQLQAFDKDTYLTRLGEKDAKLINYLAKHKHTSPFNHCFISVRVKAPIFVSRQLVKHKFMPWNEVSRRYVDDEPECYLPPSWRSRPDSSIKQGSGDREITHLRHTDPNIHESWTAEVNDSFFLKMESDYRMYQDMLKAGICPEQARMVLPQNTMTEWIWSGTLGAFADMLKLRLSPYTQQETREVAEQIKALVEPLFPVALPALLNNKE